MEPVHIPDADALDLAIAKGAFLLFKHSFRCPASVRAFAEYEAFAAAHPAVPTGWVDVIEQRPLTRGITDAHGIGHESPQALWFRDGRVVWHASHDAITTVSLVQATRTPEPPALRGERGPVSPRRA
jgi:bacillithiol system protein YtxJ